MTASPAQVADACIAIEGLELAVQSALRTTADRVAERFLRSPYVECRLLSYAPFADGGNGKAPGPKTLSNAPGNEPEECGRLRINLL
jgi:hypothetical protein